MLVMLILMNAGMAYYIYFNSTYVNSRAMRAMEDKADAILREVDESKQRIDKLYTEIDNARDTIQIIAQKRITNNNTYVQQISRILSADSTHQYAEYKRNSTKFDSLFFDGFFFNRKPR